MNGSIQSMSCLGRQCLRLLISASIHITHYVYPKSEMIPRHSLKCPGRGMNRWIRIWVVLLASLDAYFRIVFRYGGLILLNMQRPRRAPRSKPRPSVSINAGTFYLHGVKPSQSTHSDDQDQVQWRASCRRMRVTCPALTSRKKADITCTGPIEDSTVHSH